MRTLLWFVLGFGLALAAALFAVAAGVLVTLGLAAHYLVKREPGMGDIFSFDPSNMVARAPAPAAAALGFLVIFFALAIRLRRTVRVARSAV